MSPQAANNKPFSVDDARKALVIRGYVLTIERKLISLLQSDDTGQDFAEAIQLVRAMLTEIDKIEVRHSMQPCRCYEGYECCDGICQVWCS